MKLNILLYTVEPINLDFVRDRLRRAKGRDDVTFTIRKITAPQTLKTIKDADGDVRPDWAELKRLFPADGHNAVGFHFTRKDKRRYKIAPRLNGSYNRLETDVLQFWFCADTGKARNYPFLEYERLLLHEIGHGDSHWSGTRDRVHQCDYVEHAIDRYAEEISYVTWNTLHALKEKLKALINKPMLPIPKQFFNRITQPFLTPSNHYRSGVHNGTDFGCPIGTPVYAPQDGQITARFIRHASLGTAIYFVCATGPQIRFLHLSQAMPKGTYKKGDIIGYTGNTGDSTGPHLHVDVWSVPINTSLIRTRAGVEKYLIDPVKFFTK